MKRLALLAVVALTTVMAYAASLNTKWVTAAPVFSNNGLDVYFALNFENPQTAIVSAICRMGSEELIASVSVPYSSTESEISVRGTANTEVEKNGMKCNVSVEPGTMRYVATEAELVLNPGSQQLKFVRQ